MFFGKREGYVMVDHRASPGLPEDVARMCGYDPALCREGKMYEAASLTCAHCKVAVVKNPLRTRERANCAKCGFRYICDLCDAARFHADYVHTPFEQRFEEALSGQVQTPANPHGLILPPGFTETE